MIILDYRAASYLGKDNDRKNTMMEIYSQKWKLVPVDLSGQERLDCKLQ